MAKARKVAIAVDTSAWLSLFEQKVDFRESTALPENREWVLPSPVIRELVQLAQKGPVMAKKVAVAKLAILATKPRMVPMEEKNADKALIKLATQGVIIATNDARLRSAVRKAGGQCLFLRKKQYWTME